jgi:hypothetical protein
MADVDVSLDSSDIPVILDALEMKKASLKRIASNKMSAAQGPLREQIDLLINTFKSAVGPGPDSPPT